MANAENLIPMDKRSQSEARELGKKGGIASGASRRAYRSLKQAAKAFFKENDDAAMQLIQALYEEARNGNVKALEKLQDLIGETVQQLRLIPAGYFRQVPWSLHWLHCIPMSLLHILLRYSGAGIHNNLLPLHLLYHISLTVLRRYHHFVKLSER